MIRLEMGIHARAMVLACTAAAMPAAVTAAAVPATVPAAPVAGAPSIGAEAGSYDLGMMLGTQLSGYGLAGKVSRAELLRGLDAALAGAVPTAAQRESALQYARQAHDALAARNHQLAQEFLDKNRGQPGIVSLGSGLQYRVLIAGESSAPAVGPADEVDIGYTLSLPDGKVLDRSDDHPQAAIFRMNAVIPAWREALLAMRPGAKWRLFVPPELGYGANSPPPIPANALVIYDLELKAIQPAVHPPAQVPHRPSTGAVPAPAASRQASPPR